MEGNGLPSHQQAGEAELAGDRERLCAQFSGIAGCDPAVAQCYLAENDWELDRAINSFFEPGIETTPQDINSTETRTSGIETTPQDRNSTGPSTSGIETTPQDRKSTEASTSGIETTTQDRTSAKAGTSEEQTMPVTATDCCIDLTDDEPAVIIQASSTNNPPTLIQKDESHFTFLTWNIDGLDQSNLPERARGVCSYLALYSPDIVFLQEVIPPYYEYLKKRAVSYNIITGNEDGYFTAIMLKKSRVKLIDQEIIPFPGTSMMRNLLVANVNISGNIICLMTSHLESTKDFANERINQLNIVLKKILAVPPSTTVIFGGDTNLRDKEVQKIGGLPNNILDVWEFLGKPENSRYTWDTKVNNNLKIAYTSRLRFDRILYRASLDGSQVIPQSLDLVGTEKLDCGRFPSDHWGLLCDFDVIL